MYDNARVLGLKKWQIFEKITAFYMKKPIISSIFAVFTLIFTDYGVPNGFDLPDRLCPVCGNPLMKDGMEKFFLLLYLNYVMVILNYQMKYKKN